MLVICCCAGLYFRNCATKISRKIGYLFSVKYCMRNSCCLFFKLCVSGFWRRKRLALYAGRSCYSFIDFFAVYAGVVLKHRAGYYYIKMTRRMHEGFYQLRRIMLTKRLKKLRAATDVKETVFSKKFFKPLMLAFLIASFNQSYPALMPLFILRRRFLKWQALHAMVRMFSTVGIGGEFNFYNHWLVAH